MIDDDHRTARLRALELSGINRTSDGSSCQPASLQRSPRIGQQDNQDAPPPSDQCEVREAPSLVILK
jgi:hypothetical protein